MTEAEWLACADPGRMVSFAAAKSTAQAIGAGFLSTRKLRLYLLGCCRRGREHLLRPSTREALAQAERFAESSPPPTVRATVASILAKAGDEPPTVTQLGPSTATLTFGWDAVVGNIIGRVCEPAGYLRERLSFAVSEYAHTVRADAITPIKAAAIPVELARTHAAITATRGPEGDGGDTLHGEELSAMADLLRCVAGNPFRPVVTHPRWLTSTVTGLARTIYDDRRFDRLPILADALEDAECDDADILGHLHGDGPHVRGCWAVDLILGKG